MHTQQEQIAKTQYLVEACDYNVYEKLVCYLKMYTDEQWKQMNPGYMFVVGKIGGRPVTLNLSWVEINGVVVCFYQSYSEVVDWAMIEEWIREQFKGVPTTDYNNIHNLTWFIKEANEK